MDDTGYLDLIPTYEEVSRSRVPAAEAIVRLAHAFPSLRTVVRAPFDGVQLAEWLGSGAPTSGSSEAALFVLEVWNGCSDLTYCRECGRFVDARESREQRGVFVVTENHISEGKPCRGVAQAASVKRFSLAHAIGVWDERHQAAFKRWARSPFAC